MSMLTIRRSIDRGLAARLVSGLGIASAVATYGAIAVAAIILSLASISIATGLR